MHGADILSFHHILFRVFAHDFASGIIKFIVDFQRRA
jgi:hypothetical protein